ncbi:MAG: ArsA family ATPase [Myxococcales bacterium]|nr:ArsA family ATPase [Myxococcales bacterium]
MNAPIQAPKLEHESADHLLSRELLFFTGKGGVGKTTIAVAFAKRAVELGKRVLLCEVAAGSSIGHMLGKPDIGFEPVEVFPNLHVTVCEPRQSLISFLSRFVKVRRLAKAMVTNRVTSRFFEAAPAVLETVVLERIGWFLRQMRGGEKPYDIIIVDMPSSGHAVTFLDTPRTMSELMNVGALATHLQELDKLLVDPKAVELVLVTLPEQMPVQETIELWKTARSKLKMALTTVVVNRIRGASINPRLAGALREVPAGEFRDSSIMRAARLVELWSADDRRFVHQLHSTIDARFVHTSWHPDFETESDLIASIVSEL